MPLKIVLDTNILLVSISPNSPYRWLFDSFLEERFYLCVSTEILFEYEEILTRHMGAKLTNTIMQILENAVNVELITRYYHWDLIKIDQDDNKFTDCAIAANANFIVTHDKHFNILMTIDFPKLSILNIHEFKNYLNNL